MPPGAPEPCLARCGKARADLVFGELLRGQYLQCLRKRLNDAPGPDDCDAFLGCSLRVRLLGLQREPWRRVALDARQLLVKVQELVAAGDPAGGVTHCLAGAGLRQGLQRLSTGARGAAPEPSTRSSARAAREILSELDNRCGDAQAAAVQALAKSIEAAVRELRLDAAGAACQRLKDLRMLPGTEASEPQGASLAEASRACGALDPLRALATAVADAEADSALVARELERGEAGTVAFHKCVHKAATLATLEASDHPRARAAAKTLRAACFERFPVEWLREVQRQGAPPDRALCYRVRLVSRLLQDPGSPAEQRGRHRALSSWAAAQCP